MSEIAMLPEIIQLNNPELIIFDFDRTLFDVDRFWNDFLIASEEILGVDPETLDATHKAERKTDEVYDAFAEIESLIDTELTDDDIQALRERLQQSANDFVIEGASEAFGAARESALVHIVTVGNERFQRFKFGLIEDRLTGGNLPDAFTCMEGSKADYITNIADRNNVPISDVAYIEDRPAHIKNVSHLVKQGLQAVWFNSPAARPNRPESPPNVPGIWQTSNIGRIIFYEEQFDVKAS